MGFPNNFLWGAASASHQIEGAYLEDNKSPSIWDVLYPGNTAYSEHGHIACDHYHRFEEDISLMKEIGLKTYRFSISWPRVIPAGYGPVNEKGLSFYSNLVDKLIEAKIEPIVTLFHWDLPYALHLQGGWLNGSISDWFADYVKAVVERLSDRVKYWVTINEPQCFIGLGYEKGIHAPFYQEKPSLAHATRNALLAHGKAVKVIREHARTAPQIGMAPCGPIFLPMDDTPEQIEECRTRTFEVPQDSFNVPWFCDAPLLGEFPQAVCDYLGVDQVVSSEDLKIIHQPLDFFGFNLYHGTQTESEPNYQGTAYPGCPRTTMNWTINPEVMYWSVKFLTDRYKLPVLITENGMANTDFVMIDGKVHDPQRIDYVSRYLKYLKKAVDEGYQVIGYTYWSLTDNFEWADGYDRRFGLIHIDYRTQKRTLKDSAYWYKDLIASNGKTI